MKFSPPFLNILPTYQTHKVKWSGQIWIHKGDLALCQGGSVPRGPHCSLLLVGSGCCSEGSLDAMIQGALDEYIDIFQEPPGLQPNGRHDHAIVIKEGANIPNLRSFPMPPLPKDRNRKTHGKNVEFTSPYASPIILVKKKDGSWRFSVNYTGH